MERGHFTEEEYRDTERERAELIRRVPPEVEADGLNTAEVWADEWGAKDPRLWACADRSRLGPRAPLD